MEEKHLDTKRLELIKEVLDWMGDYELHVNDAKSRHLRGNSAGWVDVSCILIASIVGRKPRGYINNRNLAIVRRLKQNPGLYERVKIYVNSYDKSPLI